MFCMSVLTEREPSSVALPGVFPLKGLLFNSGKFFFTLRTDDVTTQTVKPTEPL